MIEFWALNNLYTGCPQKSGTLDFCYFDIRKYSLDSNIESKESKWES